MMAAWATELLLITLKDLGINPPGIKWAKGSPNRVNGLPLPADFVATFIVMAPLAALAEVPSARGFATAAAWAFVLASLLSAIDPTDPLGNAKLSKSSEGNP